MNVCYNPQGIGDILIVPIKREQQPFEFEKYGDIIKIVDLNKNVVGYNIFNASKHFTLEDTGFLLFTEELLNEMKNLFIKEKLADPLNFDITPKFVVGHVLGKEQHKDADKLSVCQVDLGGETEQIVCGAANVDQGQNVVVAKVGATMPGGLKIKPTELRGVASNGMICSREELGLENPDHEKGIYILENSYEVGEAFLF